MADVGVLFSRLGATPLSDRSQAHPGPGEKGIAGAKSSGGCGAMRANPRAIEVNRPAPCRHRPVDGSITPRRAVATGFGFVLALMTFCVTNCVTTSRHHFSEPAGNWQIKNGQLMYRTTTTTLIGDVLIRFSKSGDFEMTFSKGPGVTLLSLRQDATFAEVNGPFAKGRWSGAVDQAPKPLRGWLGLRDRLIHSQDQSVRYTAGNETFLFRF